MDFEYYYREWLISHAHLIKTETEVKTHTAKASYRKYGLLLLLLLFERHSSYHLGEMAIDSLRWLYIQNESTDHFTACVM